MRRRSRKPRVNNIDKAKAKKIETPDKGMVKKIVTPDEGKAKKIEKLPCKPKIGWENSRHQVMCRNGHDCMGTTKAISFK